MSLLGRAAVDPGLLQDTRYAACPWSLTSTSSGKEPVPDSASPEISPLRTYVTDKFRTVRFPARSITGTGSHVQLQLVGPTITSRADVSRGVISCWVLVADKGISTVSMRIRIGVVGLNESLP